MKRTKNTGTNKLQNTSDNQPKRQRISDNIGGQAQSSAASSKVLFFILVISLLTAIAYSPIRKAEITNWDDNEYLIKNPYLKSLSGENIKAIFSANSFMGNYHPLAMLSLSVDYSMSGEDEEGNLYPFIYHLINLILHILTTVLVFFFGYKFFGNINIALLAGILFGVHTLHTESVVWISERKDVLYAFFFMASLLAYLIYIQKQKFYYFIIALLLFILSLLSKGQAVTLALSIVVMDIYFKRKIWSVKLIAEKIPFFALSILFGLLAIEAQQQGEALTIGGSYNILQRIFVASYGFTMYLLKLILPVDLAAIYPYPDIRHQTVPWFYKLSIIVPLLLAFIFYKSLKNNKVVAFSMAFFVVNILLLLQLIPVGSAVYADRYAYIPSVGFFMLVAYFVNLGLTNYTSQKRIIIGIFSIYVVVLTVLTFERTKVWENSESLWEDTVDKSPTAVVALNNRGSLYNTGAEELASENNFAASGRLRKQAIQDFDAAIKVKPDYVHAYYNRGFAKLELGKNTRDSSIVFSAIDDFTEALNYDPVFAEAYHSRANAKSELHQYSEAASDYSLAIDINPESVFFLINRGINYGKMGNLEEALEDLNLAVQKDPENVSAYSNRGRAYAGMKAYDKAIENYTTALEIEPGSKTPLFNRGIALLNTQKYEAAVKDFTDVILIEPNMTAAYLSRGQALIAGGRNADACKDFKKAASRGDQSALLLFNKYCKN